MPYDTFDSEEELIEAYRAADTRQRLAVDLICGSVPATKEQQFYLRTIRNESQRQAKWGVDCKQVIEQALDGLMATIPESEN